MQTQIEPEAELIITPKQNVQNWSKTITYSTSRVLMPSNQEELIGILRDPMIKNVKVQGSGHTFNRIADTTEDGVFINLKKFKNI